jgi:thiamine biosynthesis lipoprotein
VGINKPMDDSTQVKNEIQEVVEIKSGGMATSGNYRNFYMKDGKKYAHIINPKTGFPVNHNLLSATIIAEDCMTADAFATACMVLGLEGSLRLCETHPNLAGFFIYDDNGVYKTAFSANFQRYLIKK